MEAAPCHVITLFHYFIEIKCFNIIIGSIANHWAKAPNALRIVAERPSADERRRYKTARQQAALYRAASMLWTKGIPMNNAIQIVESAMRDAGEL